MEITRRKERSQGRSPAKNGFPEMWNLEPIDDPKDETSPRASNILRVEHSLH